MDKKAQTKKIIKLERGERPILKFLHYLLWRHFVVVVVFRALHRRYLWYACGVDALRAQRA